MESLVTTSLKPILVRDPTERVHPNDEAPWRACTSFVLLFYISYKLLFSASQGEVLQLIGNSTASKDSLARILSTKQRRASSCDCERRLLCGSQG